MLFEKKKVFSTTKASFATSSSLQNQPRTTGRRENWPSSEGRHSGTSFTPTSVATYFYATSAVS